MVPSCKIRAAVNRLGRHSVCSYLLTLTIVPLHSSVRDTKVRRNGKKKNQLTSAGTKEENGQKNGNRDVMA